LNAEAREQAGVVTPEPPPSETLALRPSHELLQVPPERAEPIAPGPAPAASTPAAVPAAAHAQTQVPATPRPAPVVANAQAGADGPDARAQVQVQFHPHSLTWLTGGLALLAGFGWVALSVTMIAQFERRPAAYVLVNGGYVTTSFTIMGAILGGWR
jgi:hypothetical protein